MKRNLVPVLAWGFCGWRPVRGGGGVCAGAGDHAVSRCGRAAFADQGRYQDAGWQEHQAWT